MVLLNLRRAAGHHVLSHSSPTTRLIAAIYNTFIVTKPFRVELDLLFSRPSYYLYSSSAGSHRNENQTEKLQTKK